MGSRGAGVVVGIVDTGCDFAHRNFIDARGRTRIEAIWVQGAGADPRRAVPYGRLYEAQQIQSAMAAADPYVALGYGPAPSVGLSPGTHGTHVMDIAAGSGQGSGVVGMASDASVLFVDLATDDVPWSGPERIGHKFGDSVRLAEAIKWIFDRAGDRPCVINVSLGTNGGPHDGTNPFERAVDGLLYERPNRAVVIAASNSRADGIHAKASIAAADQRDLRIVTPRDAECEAEVWYNSPARLDIELLSPDGASLGRVQPGSEGRVDDDNGRTVVFIASRTQDPANGDNTIGVYLSEQAPPGTWTLRLHNTGAAAAELHAWIERNDGAQSSFVAGDADPDFTLGSISCGHAAITVASYDAHKPQRTISYFSSAGPTHDNRQKPEIAAPGSDVLAAQSGTLSGVVSKSGTSMAAPLVTGAIAIMLGEAIVNGRSLDIETIRQKLTRGARDVTGAGGWNNRYGYGGLDAARMV
jgi:subtilisin family serine protease